MTCYGYFRSSAAYRCRIAFNLKGVSPEFAPVHLRRGEQTQRDFKALNPQGLVPAVTSGDLVLTQSLAIIEWLDETQGGRSLLPADPGLRAQVRAFAQVIACDIHPLQNLRVLTYLKTELGHDQAAADAWCRHWIGEGLAACEEIVEREPDRGRFCFGDEPGLADICLVPQMFSGERFGVDLSAMPRLREIRAACDKLPAFADAHPARQPDYDL
ncbi:maleylacetoacetate isomerase [Microbaculum marinum]|uniref:Maleylacetoacetate isomerase n=1 Tax=Microbaculum marinum TaxID=1764581 RepID=A0AAW9RSV9_9HYPH